MILQKWKDSERIYVTLVNDDSGTILQANRFWITDIIPDVGEDGELTCIRLFADGRMLSSISVAERVIESEKGNHPFRLRRKEVITDEED